MDSDDKDQASDSVRFVVLFKSGARQEFSASDSSFSQAIDGCGFSGRAKSAGFAINLEEAAAIYRVNPAPVDGANISRPLFHKQIPFPAQIKRARRHLGLSEADWMHAEIAPDGTLIARAMFGNFQTIPAVDHGDHPVEGGQG